MYANAFTRKDLLKRFTEIVEVACQVTDKSDASWKRKPLPITMTGLSQLERSKKELLMQNLAKDDLAKKALRPLILLNSLPDQELWMKLLGTAKPEEDWEILAHSIAKSYFHQSQEATDCRWVKVLYLIKSRIITFTTKTIEPVQLIVEYPTHSEWKYQRHS